MSNGALAAAAAVVDIMEKSRIAGPERVWCTMPATHTGTFVSGWTWSASRPFHEAPRCWVDIAYLRADIAARQRQQAVASALEQAAVVALAYIHGVSPEDFEICEGTNSRDDALAEAIRSVATRAKTAKPGSKMCLVPPKRFKMWNIALVGDMLCFTWHDHGRDRAASLPLALVLADKGKLVSKHLATPILAFRHAGKRIRIPLPLIREAQRTYRR